jgi:hypothetical protein
MLRYIFWFLTIYFLYRLVFNFIIPVWRVSRQMKGQVRDFQDRMSAQNEAAPTSSPNTAQPQPKPATEKKGDYIDFEEVK